MISDDSTYYDSGLEVAESQKMMIKKEAAEDRAVVESSSDDLSTADDMNLVDYEMTGTSEFVEKPSSVEASLKALEISDEIAMENDENLEVLAKYPVSSDPVNAPDDITSGVLPEPSEISDNVSMEGRETKEDNSSSSDAENAGNMSKDEVSLHPKITIEMGMAEEAIQKSIVSYSSSLGEMNAAEELAIMSPRAVESTEKMDAEVKTAEPPVENGASVEDMNAGLEDCFHSPSPGAIENLEEMDIEGETTEPCVENCASVEDTRAGLEDCFNSPSARAIEVPEIMDTEVETTKPCVESFSNAGDTSAGLNNCVNSFCSHATENTGKMDIEVEITNEPPVESYVSAENTSTGLKDSVSFLISC